MVVKNVDNGGLRLEKDWSEEFQFILEMDDSIRKYYALSRLASDFAYASKLYAMVGCVCLLMLGYY